MRSKFVDVDATADLVAEMRAVADDVRGAVETSQAILDRCAAGADGREAPRAGSAELLGEISDGLIAAYDAALRDGDRMTVTLVERALFHVGRRLALDMTPAEAGLACH